MFSCFAVSSPAVCKSVTKWATQYLNQSCMCALPVCQCPQVPPRIRPPDPPCHAPLCSRFPTPKWKPRHSSYHRICAIRADVSPRAPLHSRPQSAPASSQLKSGLSQDVSEFRLPGMDLGKWSRRQLKWIFLPFPAQNGLHVAACIPLKCMHAWMACSCINYP